VGVSSFMLKLYPTRDAADVENTQKAHPILHVHVPLITVAVATVSWAKGSGDAYLTDDYIHVQVLSNRTKARNLGSNVSDK